MEGGAWMQAIVQADPRMARGGLVREETEIYDGRPQERDGGSSGRTHWDSRKAELEEKIRRLRLLMEQAAADENSFTSEAVVQLSMKLDELINDYHQFMENYKNSPK